MNKTKIDWADYSFNPVTGCLHGCEYCYARKIADRFSGGGYGKELGMFISKYREDAFVQPYDLKEPHLAKTKDDWYREAPYPFGFAPTFHRYRLNEPAKIKTPQRIFVCSMADLFGDWVPEEWIKEVFKACEAAPQHIYLFLTKNPKPYAGTWLQDEIIEHNLHKNSYFGVSVCNQEMADEAVNYLGEVRGKIKNFLSIEPIQEQVEIPKEAISFGPWFKWVIIGAETGNHKGKVIPKREWIESIVNQCRAHDIPVFMKSSLAEIWGEELIQEYPWEVKV